jgi:hypothetical protein
MPDQPRDWDKELAAIDAEIAKLPAPKPGGAPPAPRGGGAPAAAPGPAAPGTARIFLGAWVRALAGAALAVAVWSWPYAHRCGWGLYGYLGAVLMVLVAGVWSSIATWRRRMGLAHIVSLAVLVAGLAFAAAEILPRAGYAKIPLTWTCP